MGEYCWQGCRRKGEYIIMGNMEQKRRKRQQKKRMQRHKRSVFAVCAVIALLFIVVSVNSVTLKAKEQVYKAQEQELEEQIEEEKARAKEIEELDEYVGTDEYVEDVAKEKLGLIHENEIIFKAK